MATIQPETPSPRSHPDWDVPHATAITPEEDIRTVLVNRISWGAVFAGVALALATQLVLNLLGLGIGASTFDPAANAYPSATSVSVGAGLWWLISGIIAALVGGYTAGRLCGQPRRTSGGWHGLTAWALSALLMIAMLTTTLGSILGGAFSGIASIAGGVAQGLGTTAQTAIQTAAPGIYQAADPFAAIDKAVREAGGGSDPAAVREAAVAAVRALVTGDPARAQEARDRAVQAIAKAQGIPTEQARAQVARYEQRYREIVDEAKQQTTAAAQMATTAVSRGALLGALALALGALAAWLGGRMGVVDPDVTRAEMVESPRTHLH